MTAPVPDDAAAGPPLPAADVALMELITRPRRAPGPDTMAIVGRLAARPPEPPPSPPPAVPGLTDLVEVGRGGMGVVYRARESRLDRVVAVKVLAPDATPTPERRSRAEREALLLTRIVHPNVVQILYVTDVAGAPADLTPPRATVRRRSGGAPLTRGRRAGPCQPRSRDWRRCAAGRRLAG